MVFELMIPGEDQCFLDFPLAGVGILLHFLLQKNNLVDEIQNCILLQNIFPHIGHIDTIGIMGVALTGIDALTASLVER